MLDRFHQRHRTSKATFSISISLFVLFFPSSPTFHQQRYLFVSHPLGKNKLGVDTGGELGRDEPQFKADAYFPAERFADNGVVC